MSTLLLKLAAPLQSWGDFSRFTRRTTRHEPTKSAVLGLIAAAQGRRRTDPIEDLLSLKFGVRIDQEGVMLRDFHTARRNNNGSMPLSDRFYLSDAIYVAGLETEQITLEGIADSLMHPVFPLFLGRRSCAPSGKLVLGISDEALIPSLRNHPWEASLWYKQKKARESPGEVRLELIRDAMPDDDDRLRREVVHDLPINLSQEHRQYGWRDVVHDDPVVFENPCGRKLTGAPTPPPTHDPMTVFEGE